MTSSPAADSGRPAPEVRRFRKGDPLGGLPLRQALLVAAVAAVVLPLLVVTTALTGFSAVERAHANAISLLTQMRRTDT